jgi:hypothetical protein
MSGPRGRGGSPAKQSLIDRGFDLSMYDRQQGYWRVRCSQCEALVINGLACHETGCPNSKRRNEDE